MVAGILAPIVLKRSVLNTLLSALPPFLSSSLAFSPWGNTPSLPPLALHASEWHKASERASEGGRTQEQQPLPLKERERRNERVRGGDKAVPLPPSTPEPVVFVVALVAVVYDYVAGV